MNITINEFLLFASLVANAATIYDVFLRKSSVKQRLKHLELSISQIKTSSVGVNSKGVSTFDQS